MTTNQLIKLFTLISIFLFSKCIENVSSVEDVIPDDAVSTHPNVESARLEQILVFEPYSNVKDDKGIGVASIVSDNYGCSWDILLTDRRVPRQGEVQFNTNVSYANGNDPFEGFIVTQQLQKKYFNDEFSIRESQVIDARNRIRRTITRYTSENDNMFANFLNEEEVSYTYNIENGINKITSIETRSRDFVAGDQRIENYNVTSDEFGNILSITSRTTGDRLSIIYDYNVYNPFYLTVIRDYFTGYGGISDLENLINIIMVPHAISSIAINDTIVKEFRYLDVFDNGFPEFLYRVDYDNQGNETITPIELGYSWIN